MLIPRTETEQWAFALAERIARSEAPRPVSILDLCTGSGCIALALAHGLRSWPCVRITGIDSDARAVALATENAEANGLRATFALGDMLDDACVARLGTFDMVVCNPPYIAQSEWPALDASVRRFESRAALVGHARSGDGYAYYRRLREVLDRLAHVHTPLPRMVMEVGAGQAQRVAALFAPHPTETWRDDGGWDRVVAVMSPSSSSTRQ